MVIGLILSASFFSCARQEAAPDWAISAPRRVPEAPDAFSTYAYRYPDQAPVMNAEDLKAFLARYPGRLTLLDFWASWSSRSRDEMASLSWLNEELSNRKFMVVSCNFDPKEVWAEKTVPILHGIEANFPCVVIPREARMGLREWLSTNWIYDLPTRFLVDSNGTVLAKAFSDTSLSEFRDEVRRVVVARQPYMETADPLSGAVRLRLRMVDVRTGEVKNLPEIMASRPDAKQLGEQTARALMGRLDRQAQPRVAILPFRHSSDRARAGKLGCDAAGHAIASLKRSGFYDLPSDEAILGQLAAVGISERGLEDDPSSAAGKASADYIVMGRLRGAGEVDAPPELARGDLGMESGGR